MPPDDQLSLNLAGDDVRVGKGRVPKAKRTGAFTDNMSLPVHRWFRYSAGFSAEWAEQVIADHRPGEGEVILDPFAGSGTTLLAAQTSGVAAHGAEPHPFVRRIAEAKLLWSRTDARELFEKARILLDDAAARERRAASIPDSDLLLRCYNPETFRRLDALREAYADRHAEAGVAGELLWLAITSILRECSGVGTAQWQYVLPNRTKARVLDPFSAFLARAKLFCSDIERMRERALGSEASVAPADARTLSGLARLRGRVGLVVTSPPYPNNYDYADATRLEMTFWGEISGWSDLQGSVRKHLVRSCSQHSAAERLVLEELLADEAVAPIRRELTAACEALAAARETRGGRKTYHTMVAAYFVDLARSWRAIHGLCADSAKVCFVVGDSAPYGVHVPVERWLGELALAAGFRSWSFEKVRDRNTKWRNRKHRVPLQEGNLWVRN